jgi:hypothetical protein
MNLFLHRLRGSREGVRSGKIEVLATLVKPLIFRDFLGRMGSRRGVRSEQRSAFSAQRSGADEKQPQVLRLRPFAGDGFRSEMTAGFRKQKFSEPQILTILTLHRTIPGVAWRPKK